MADFKPGDTVQLKSGGPIMTVKFVDNDGSNDHYCEWFSDKELKGARFTGTSLKQG